MDAYINPICAALFDVATFPFSRLTGPLNCKEKPRPADFDLSVIYHAHDPEVDIVLVHGLGTDSRSAWSVAGSDFCWPSSALPHKLGVDARILAYDYDSTFRTPEYLTCRTLLHQTRGLVEALARHRKKNPARPIIFVCHSLGGIVVKNALVNARTSQEEELVAVHSATVGVVFLGTPHTSSHDRLAASLCRILDVDARDEIGLELHQRSANLAYNLERFKPLATNLHICAITETPTLTRNDTDLDKPPNCRYHKTFGLVRDHASLCKYSDPEDPDLDLVIASIREICERAKENAEQNKSLGPRLQTHRRMVAGDVVCEVGMGKALKRAINRVRKVDLRHGSQADGQSKSASLTKHQLSSLDHYFVKWIKPVSSPDRDRDASPIVILQGPAGSGKTSTALRFVDANQHNYASIFWVNATNRKALKMSFRDIANRIISGCPGSQNAAANLLGLDGIGLQGPDELSDEDLGIAVQAVTEWLTRPHQQKWLLVLDGLSLASGYPTPAIWTAQHGESESWRELLGLLPPTTGKAGHIVITTRSTVAISGPKIIPFKTPHRRRAPKVSNPSPGLDKTPKSLPTCWARVLELTLFLSDQTCPNVPDLLLETKWLKSCERLEMPGLAYDEHCFRLSDALRSSSVESLLDPDSSSEEAGSMAKAVSRIWEALNRGIQSIRSKRDLVFAWDAEAQIAQNISALLRNLKRYDKGLKGQALWETILFGDDKDWADLAFICETHAEYSTAKKLFEVEREKQEEGSKAQFALRLDCARVYQRFKNYRDAESQYKEIDRSESKELRIAACRQFASMQASRGKYAEAAEKLSGVLALEDPFGDDAWQKQVAESMGELATYLARDGNRSAASAILQRMLVPLEVTRGRMHPATLNTMEALSMIKLDEGELSQAQNLLQRVYDSQKERLGEKHPVTLMCWYKMAAASDLGGDPERAEALYVDCLEAAVESLGPYHPSLIMIRVAFFRCLRTLRKLDEAKEQLRMLEEGTQRFPDLYPVTMARQIVPVLNGVVSVDEVELGSELSRRATLGMDIFYGNEAESEEDSVDGQEEFY